MTSLQKRSAIHEGFCFSVAYLTYSHVFGMGLSVSPLRRRRLGEVNVARQVNCISSIRFDFFVVCVVRHWQ